MEIKYNIYLEKESDEEKSVSQSIVKRIKEYLNEEKKLKNSTEELYVTIFFNKDVIPDDFKILDNGICIKDATKWASNEWTSFRNTIFGLNKVDIPQNLGKVVIVFSRSKLSESDVFAVNKEEDKSTVSFEAINPDCTLDDVVMNDDEKASLLQALTIITHKDLIFKEWGFEKIDKNTKSILCFHGAPGTGKTMCANAVADYLGKKILIGSYSKIQSKFVGDGEKNLVAYFKAAQDQDAVLFIDEADTFLSRRLPSSNENSKHYNSMSNELFQLIENFNGCIVFASNHIKDFDPAVISRIIEPIEFKLPDKATRVKIIRKHIPPKAPITLSDDEISLLADLTDGFSGRDIRKAALLFVASAAYNHCVMANEKSEEILLDFKEIEQAFVSVKKNKDNLKKSISGISAPALVASIAKKRTRLLQIAAHTLWTDGIIDEKEKTLFKELCNQFEMDIDISDRTSLPDVESICSKVIDKVEKIQILDIACRMAAVDLKYPEEEQIFIANLATLLGVSTSGCNMINEYINKLIAQNNQWKEITYQIDSSEHDIFSSLCAEYSVASSWNKLGLAYLSGDVIEGKTLPINSARAKICLEKAKSLGYKISKESENILSED